MVVRPTDSKDDERSALGVPRTMLKVELAPSRAAERGGDLERLEGSESGRDASPHSCWKGVSELSTRTSGWYVLATDMDRM